MRQVAQALLVVGMIAPHKFDMLNYCTASLTNRSEGRSILL